MCAVVDIGVKYANVKYGGPFMGRRMSGGTIYDNTGTTCVGGPVNSLQASCKFERHKIKYDLPTVPERHG
jgi:hypothetical protein